MSKMHKAVEHYVETKEAEEVQRDALRAFGEWVLWFIYSKTEWAENWPDVMEAKAAELGLIP